MLDDFTPIVHRLEGRTVKVWAVADVHIGAKECDLAGFKRFLAKIQADPDSYIVLVGDMINNGLKDNLTNVYEEVIPPHAQIDKCAELLEPVKDKILGAVGGNHEARSRKAVDLDPMYAVMCMLGKQELYRQNLTFIRVVLAHGNTKDNHTLLLVHGKSERAKRNFSYSLEGVDAVISGHTHNGIVEKPARIVFTNKNRVVIKPLVSMTATSWLSYGGYASAAMYRPSATSSPQYLELGYSGSNNAEGQIKVVW